MTIYIELRTSIDFYIFFKKEQIWFLVLVPRKICVKKDQMFVKKEIFWFLGKIFVKKEIGNFGPPKKEKTRLLLDNK